MYIVFNKNVGDGSKNYVASHDVLKPNTLAYR